MASPSTNGKGRLLAISDLHVAFPENRKFVEELPPSYQDWLLAAGDVGQKSADIEWALSTLRPSAPPDADTPGQVLR
jgi:hypothetical protein